MAIPALLMRMSSAALAFEGRPDHRLHARFVGHVDRDRESVKPGRAHRRRGGLGRGLVEVGDRNARSRGGQHLGGLATDPARAPGDDRDAVVETHEITNIRHECLPPCAAGFSRAQPTTSGGAKRPSQESSGHLTLPANRDLCAARTKYRFS